MNNFETALKHLLVHEGGYINHPHDPGGRTNLGITQRVYEEWIGGQVDEAKMRSLTPEDVAPIYRKHYWDKSGCTNLNSGVDYVVFDFSVNAGVARSAMTLQAVVGTIPDGVVGPKTIQTTNLLDAQDVIKMFSDKRIEFYKSLSTFNVFGKGWLRRVEEVKKIALEMADGTKT